LRFAFHVLGYNTYRKPRFLEDITWKLAPYDL